MAKPWRGHTGFRKVSGAKIGALAVKIYECNGCHVQFRGDRPQQCKYCGRLDFTKIDSATEANRLGELRLLLAAGKIKNLETQVRLPLMAARADGKAVKVGEYIADFVYDRTDDGAHVIEDAKSDGVMSDLASWKLRHMAAQGMPVSIVTSKGRF